MERTGDHPLDTLQQHYTLKEYQTFPPVFLVTTMWDVLVEPCTGDRHLKELREGYWAEMMKKGARELALRRDDPNASRNLGAEGPSIVSVKEVVQSVIKSSSNASSITLNSSRTAIQGELQQGKGALNTAAGHVLYKQTGTQKKRLREIVAKLEAEQSAIADDGTLKAMLEKELKDARDELSLVEKQEEQLVKGGARSKLKRMTLGLMG